MGGSVELLCSICNSILWESGIRRNAIPGVQSKNPNAPSKWGIPDISAHMSIMIDCIQSLRKINFIRIQELLF